MTTSLSIKLYFLADTIYMQGIRDLCVAYNTNISLLLLTACANACIMPAGHQPQPGEPCDTRSINLKLFGDLERLE